jgi:ketosteroid isomerase-like protein
VQAMAEKPPKPSPVEVVRRVNEAFNSGDLDRILALIHPEFATSVPAQFSAEPDTYSGHDGIRRYFHSFNEAMDDIRFDQESLHEVGRSVVVSLRLTARGRTTGIPVMQRMVQVWTVRDGKAVRVQSFATLAEALRAAEAVR